MNDLVIGAAAGVVGLLLGATAGASLVLVALMGVQRTVVEALPPGAVL